MFKLFTHSLTLVVLLAVPAIAVGAQDLSKSIPAGHVDISGLSGIAVVRALWVASYDKMPERPFFGPAPIHLLTDDIILKKLQDKNFKLDYLGLVTLNVEFKGNSFNPYFYDKKAGKGAAQRVIDSLRANSCRPK